MPRPILNYSSPRHLKRPPLWPWLLINLPAAFLVLVAVITVPGWWFVLPMMEGGDVARLDPQLEPYTSHGAWDYITSTPDDHENIRRTGHIDLTFYSYDFIEYGSSSDERVTMRAQVTTKPHHGRLMIATVGSVAIFLAAALTWRRVASRLIAVRTKPPS